MKKLLIILSLALAGAALGVACGGTAPQDDTTPNVESTTHREGGNTHGGGAYGGRAYGGGC